ncbi:MAG: hypothetical protein ACI4KF_10400 [Huintestinicola sp.]
MNICDKKVGNVSAYADGCKRTNREAEERGFGYDVIDSAGQLEDIYTGCSCEK